MVFKLEQTLASLLEEIELEEMVSEEFIGSNKPHSYSKYYVPVHLSKAWEEFEVRYPKEFDVMLRRCPERPPKNYYPDLRFTLWCQEIGLLIHEIIMNAMIHGNKDDPHKNVKIIRYYGKKGVVYSIEDEGNGFDIQTIVKKLRRGENYPCIFSGLGIRRLDETKMVVTTNDKGNQIILQYLLG